MEGPANPSHAWLHLPISPLSGTILNTMREGV